MTYYISSTVLHSEMNVPPSSSSRAVYSPAQETEITRVKYVKNNPHCTKLWNIPHVIKQALWPFVEGAQGALACGERVWEWVVGTDTDMNGLIGEGAGSCPAKKKSRVPDWLLPWNLKQGVMLGTGKKQWAQGPFKAKTDRTLELNKKNKREACLCLVWISHSRLRPSVLMSTLLVFLRRKQKHTLLSPQMAAGVAPSP